MQGREPSAGTGANFFPSSLKRRTNLTLAPDFFRKLYPLQKRMSVATHSSLLPFYKGELSQSQGITYTSIVEPRRLPPLCFPRYLGTGDPLHRAGHGALAELKFAAVTRLKQRSNAPHPVLRPDPGQAGRPRGHSPLTTGACLGGVHSLRPAPSATSAKPRRPNPREAVEERAPQRGSAAAPGLPLPAQPEG